MFLPAKMQKKNEKKSPIHKKIEKKCNIRQEMLPFDK